MAIILRSSRWCILGNWESKCSGSHLPKVWQLFVIGKIARTQNMTAIPFLTVGLSKQSKSIRPNRIFLNSYIEPYCSLQCGQLELSRTCRNDVGISIFLFDHTSQNMTVHNWESKCSGNAYLVIGSPDFWEMNPRTFGLPITRFAPMLCLKPNYI